MPVSSGGRNSVRENTVQSSGQAKKRKKKRKRKRKPDNTDEEPAHPSKDDGVSRESEERSSLEENEKAHSKVMESKSMDIANDQCRSNNAKTVASPSEDNSAITAEKGESLNEKKHINSEASEDIVDPQCSTSSTTKSTVLPKDSNDTSSGETGSLDGKDEASSRPSNATGKEETDKLEIEVHSEETETTLLDDADKKSNAVNALTVMEPTACPTSKDSSGKQMNDGKINEDGPNCIAEVERGTSSDPLFQVLNPTDQNVAEDKTLCDVPHTEDVVKMQLTSSDMAVNGYLKITEAQNQDRMGERNEDCMLEKIQDQISGHIDQLRQNESAEKAQNQTYQVKDQIADTIQDHAAEKISDQTDKRKQDKPEGKAQDQKSEKAQDQAAETIQYHAAEKLPDQPDKGKEEEPEKKVQYQTSEKAQGQSPEKIQDEAAEKVPNQTDERKWDEQEEKTQYLNSEAQDQTSEKIQDQAVETIPDQSNEREHEEQEQKVHDLKNEAQDQTDERKQDEPEKTQDQKSEKAQDQTAEKIQDQAAEKITDQTGEIKQDELEEKTQNQNSQKDQDQTAEKIQDQAAENVQNQTDEKEQKLIGGKIQDGKDEKVEIIKDEEIVLCAGDKAQTHQLSSDDPRILQTRNGRTDTTPAFQPENKLVEPTKSLPFAAKMEIAKGTIPAENMDNAEKPALRISLESDIERKRGFRAKLRFAEESSKMQTQCTKVENLQKSSRVTEDDLNHKLYFKACHDNGDAKEAENSDKELSSVKEISLESDDKRQKPFQVQKSLTMISTNTKPDTQFFGEMESKPTSEKLIKTPTPNCPASETTDLTRNAEKEISQVNDTASELNTNFWPSFQDKLKFAEKSSQGQVTCEGKESDERQPNATTSEAQAKHKAYFKECLQIAQGKNQAWNEEIEEDKGNTKLTCFTADSKLIFRENLERAEENAKVSPKEDMPRKSESEFNKAHRSHGKQRNEVIKGQIEEEKALKGYTDPSPCTNKDRVLMIVESTKATSPDPDTKSSLSFKDKLKYAEATSQGQTVTHINKTVNDDQRLSKQPRGKLKHLAYFKECLELANGIDETCATEQATLIDASDKLDSQLASKEHPENSSNAENTSKHISPELKSAVEKDVKNDGDNSYKFDTLYHELTPVKCMDNSEVYHQLQKDIIAPTKKEKLSAPTPNSDNGNIKFNRISSQEQAPTNNCKDIDEIRTSSRSQGERKTVLSKEGDSEIYKSPGIECHSDMSTKLTAEKEAHKKEVVLKMTTAMQVPDTATGCSHKQTLQISNTADLSTPSMDKLENEPTFTECLKVVTTKSQRNEQTTVDKEILSVGRASGKSDVTSIQTFPEKTKFFQEFSSGHTITQTDLSTVHDQSLSTKPDVHLNTKSLEIVQGKDQTWSNESTSLKTNRGKGSFISTDTAEQNKLTFNEKLARAKEQTVFFGMRNIETADQPDAIKSQNLSNTQTRKSFETEASKNSDVFEPEFWQNTKPTKLDPAIVVELGTKYRCYNTVVSETNLDEGLEQVHERSDATDVCMSKAGGSNKQLDGKADIGKSPRPDDRGTECYTKIPDPPVTKTDSKPEDSSKTKINTSVRAWQGKQTRKETTKPDLLGISTKMEYVPNNTEIVQNLIPEQQDTKLKKVPKGTKASMSADTGIEKQNLPEDQKVGKERPDVTGTQRDTRPGIMEAYKSGSETEFSKQIHKVVPVTTLVESVQDSPRKQFKGRRIVTETVQSNLFGSAVRKFSQPRNQGDNKPTSDDMFKKTNKLDKAVASKPMPIRKEAGIDVTSYITQFSKLCLDETSSHTNTNLKKEKVTRSVLNRSDLPPPWNKRKSQQSDLDRAVNIVVKTESTRSAPHEEGKQSISMLHSKESNKTVQGGPGNKSSKDDPGNYSIKEEPSKQSVQDPCSKHVQEDLGDKSVQEDPDKKSCQDHRNKFVQVDPYKPIQEETDGESVQEYPVTKTVQENKSIQEDDLVKQIDNEHTQPTDSHVDKPDIKKTSPNSMPIIHSNTDGTDVLVKDVEESKTIADISFIKSDKRLDENNVIEPILGQNDTQMDTTNKKEAKKPEPEICTQIVHLSNEIESLTAVSDGPEIKSTEAVISTPDDHLIHTDNRSDEAGDIFSLPHRTGMLEDKLSDSIKCHEPASQTENLAIKKELDESDVDQNVKTSDTEPFQDGDTNKPDAMAYTTECVSPIPCEIEIKMSGRPEENEVDKLDRDGLGVDEWFDTNAVTVLDLDVLGNSPEEIKLDKLHPSGKLSDIDIMEEPTDRSEELESNVWITGDTDDEKKVDLLHHEERDREEVKDRAEAEKQAEAEAGCGNTKAVEIMVQKNEIESNPGATFVAEMTSYDTKLWLSRRPVMKGFMFLFIGLLLLLMVYLFFLNDGMKHVQKYVTMATNMFEEPVVEPETVPEISLFWQAMNVLLPPAPN